jgi:hypothetical protein
MKVKTSGSRLSEKLTVNSAQREPESCPLLGIHLPKLPPLASRKIGA